jgi:hypothetical protein
MPRLTVEVDDAVYSAAQRRAMWERRGLREQLAVDLRGVYGCDRPVKAPVPAGDTQTDDRVPAEAGAAQ